MKKTRRSLVAASALVAGLVGGTGSGGPAEAGQAFQAMVTIDTNMFSTLVDDIADYVPVVQTTGGAPVAAACFNLLVTRPGPFSGSSSDRCTLDPGTYQLAFPTIPAGHYADISCPGGGATFTSDDTLEVPHCEVDLRSNIVTIEKSVEYDAEPPGDELTSSDFELELYDELGALIGSGFDRRIDSDPCSDIPEQCLTFDVIDGTYTLGEILPGAGWVPDASCIADSQPDEIFDPSVEGAEFQVFSDEEGGSLVHCNIVNTYETGSIVLISEVFGTEAPNNFTDWRPELYFDGENVFETYCFDDADFEDDFASGYLYLCREVPAGDYTIGYPTPVARSNLSVDCSGAVGPAEALDTDEYPSAEVTIDSGSEPFCIISMVSNVLLIDKLVEGPDDSIGPGDFELEIFHDESGALIASDVDAASDLCVDDEDAITAENCVAFDVVGGTFLLGETTDASAYVAAGLDCRTVREGDGPDSRNEEIDRPGFDVSFEQPRGNGFFGVEFEVKSCVLTNEYAEWPVTITKTVVNDSGRTAAVTDFTMEIYDSEGTLLVDGACAADGVCIETTLPPGTYTIGEFGPDGYTSTVTYEVVPEELTEQIADASATFTLEPFTNVSAAVVSDDDPLPTTTTTTTTTVAPTTAPPTTAAPTTAPPATTAAPTTVEAVTTTTPFDGSGALLPSTGASDTTWALVALALGFLVLGSGTVVLARRRT